MLFQNPFAKLLVYYELGPDCLSTGSPPVLSIAEAVGIVTAVLLITMITAAVGYFFLISRRYVTRKHLAISSFVMSWICIEL